MVYSETALSAELGTLGWVTLLSLFGGLWAQYQEQ